MASNFLYFWNKEKREVSRLKYFSIEVRLVNNFMRAKDLVMVKNLKTS